MRIMIIGAGMVGRHLCEKLSGEGQEVVLVDRDEKKLQRLERELNVMPIHGSGASPKVLEKAGIDQAELFIAVTDSDEINLISCIISRQYKVKTRIARVRNEDFYAQGTSTIEETLGIDLVISPDLAMSEEILRLVTLSKTVEVVEFGHGQVDLLGYLAKEGHPCVGSTMAALHQLQNTYHFLVVAITRGETTIIPRGNDKIELGDKIYLMVRRPDVPAVEHLLFASISRLPRQVFIIGGGPIGSMVARQIEKLNVDISLLEQNSATCKTLAAQLERTVVLNSDGLEAQDLLEEDIDQADLVIAATSSDTTNILSSLLAKHLGAKKCITLISNPSFIPMLSKLGIDVSLSFHQVAANLILRYVRRGGGRIISVAGLLDGKAEVVEMKVPDKDHFVDLPLKHLSFPRGSIVGAIIRGHQTIIPTGETQLAPDDSLIIFFTSDAEHGVASLFGK